jgi:hypothetical protein
MITGALIGFLALIILLNPSIDASWAGLALAFASTLTLDVSTFLIDHISRLLIFTYHKINISCIGL